MSKCLQDPHLQAQTKDGTLIFAIMKISVNCLIINLCLSVRQVLDFMKSVDINLPILLWAISWNIPELISDPKVSAERTALMISDELPDILAHWRLPPRKHNSGIRTRSSQVLSEE